MKFSLEKERAKHPQASLIPCAVWNVFFTDINSYQSSELDEIALELMQTIPSELTAYLNMLNLPLFNLKKREAFWIAFAYGQPETSDDLLMQFAKNLAFTSETQLKLMATIGRKNLVNRVIEQEGVNFQHILSAYHYRTFLYVAENGHLDVVNLLIEKLMEISPDKVLDMIMANNGIDMPAPYAPFLLAARSGQHDVMDVIIEKLTQLAPCKVLDMIESRFYYAFKMAAANGHLVVLERLIEKLTEIAPDKLYDMISSQGYKAFQFAAESDHLNVVNFLFEKLMSVAPKQMHNMIKSGTYNNYSAFICASRHGCFSIMHRLIEKLTEIAPNEIENMLSVDGYSAFQSAACYGHLSMMQCLIDKLTDVAPNKVKDMIEAQSSLTYLPYAAFQNAALNGHLNVIKWLIKLTREKSVIERIKRFMRRPNTLQAMIETGQYRAFSLAASNGHMHIIKYLMELMPNKVQDMIKGGFDSFQYSAFQYAAENGHIAVMDCFMTMAPDHIKNMIEAKGSNNQPYAAFLDAAQKGQIEVVALLFKKLLALAPDNVHDMIEAQNYQAFQYAASNGDHCLIAYLMAVAPNDVEAMVEAGHYKAFILAAEHGHIKVMKQLMLSAPHKIQDMIKANMNGRSPYAAFKHAGQNAHFNVMKLIYETLSTLAPNQLLKMIQGDNYHVFISAAINGHLNIIEWLFTLFPSHIIKHMVYAPSHSQPYGAFNCAAKNGHLTVLQRLIDKLTEIEPDKVPSVISGILPHSATHYLSVATGERQSITIKSSRQHSTPFQEAARKGHLDVINLLIETLTAIAPDKVQNMIEAQYNGIRYKAFLDTAQEGHLNVMERIVNKLTELAPNKVQDMMLTENCRAFRAAANSGHHNVTHYLIQHAYVFAYLDMHHHEFGVRYVRPFVEKYLCLLHSQSDAYEAHSLQAVFNIIHADQAKLCFYIVRHIIRQNNPEDLDDMNFLIGIPSVRALLHTEVTPNQQNELLLLALNTENLAALGMLLNITAVRELAERNGMYRREVRGQLALAALAQNRESSMTGLTLGEKKRLSSALKHYEPMVKTHGGTNKVMEKLRKVLMVRYLKAPARINTHCDNFINLPPTWDEWCKLRETFSVDACNQALQAYAQHKEHCAWRYLEKPNPWMAKDAPYVNRNVAGGWSTFEEYQPLIALLFLSAIDADILPTDGHTLETRLAHFINELAHISRAHNWDKERIKSDASGRPSLDESGQVIMEEYDDLDGDKPSCYSGVKRRLFQSIQGHPLLKILTIDDIKQELRGAIREHFKQCIQTHSKEAMEWYAAWNELCETGIGGEKLSAMNMSREDQKRLVSALRNKYPSQFDEDLTFNAYIQKRFVLTRHTPTHAACFGGETGLTALLKTCTEKNKPAYKTTLLHCSTPLTQQQTILRTRTRKHERKVIAPIALSEANKMLISHVL